MAAFFRVRVRRVRRVSASIAQMIGVYGPTLAEAVASSVPAVAWRHCPRARFIVACAMRQYRNG